MHYFQFQIKEWIANTAHLSLEEEAIYLRLINYYYDSEQKIPMEADLVFRKLRIADKSLGMTILYEFFTEVQDGFIHERCDLEIARYHSMAEAGKKGALKRWAKGGDSHPIDPPIAIINKELRINNKELNIKASPVAPKVAIPIGVSEEIWKDYLALRKSKKASVTVTALKGISREAEKAKLSLQEVLQICCERGWAGFKAEWITESKATKTTQDWRTNDSLMIAKATELGLHTVGLQRFEIVNKIDATIRSRGL